MNKYCLHALVQRKAQAGFSLLETLVAFAVLILVLSVTMQIYGSGSRSSRLTHEYAQATMIAKTQLAELQAGNDKLSGTEMERYHWQVQQQKANYSDPGMQEDYHRPFITNDVSVTVKWQSSGKQRRVKLDTVQLEND
jgi:type II secretory pathway pseudopilin PulG